MRVEICAETGKDENGDEHIMLMWSDADPQLRAIYRYQLGVDDDELHALFAEAAKLLAKNPGAQVNAVLQDPQGMRTDQLHPDNKWHLVLV
jgi:hypothetical protein